MMKFIGALIIFLAGVLIGLHQAARYANRPKHIRQWIQGLQRLETEINYSFTPLAQALERTSKSSAAPTASIWLSASHKLAQNDSKTTFECWSEAIEEGWDSTALKPTEKDILLQLGSTLGISDRSDQMKHIQLAMNQLQSEESIAKDEQQRYEKMWKTLGALGGALIVILMY